MQLPWGPNAPLLDACIPYVLVTLTDHYITDVSLQSCSDVVTVLADVTTMHSRQCRHLTHQEVSKTEYSLASVALQESKDQRHGWWD